MFDALVTSVALYRSKIWEGTREERVDSAKRKYLKWIMGLDPNTPNDILIEEAKCEEMSSMALKRALKYEEHTRRSNKRIVVECIRECN